MSAAAIKGFAHNGLNCSAAFEQLYTACDLGNLPAAQEILNQASREQCAALLKQRMDGNWVRVCETALLGSRFRAAAGQAASLSHTYLQPHTITLLAYGCQLESGGNLPIQSNLEWSHCDCQLPHRHGR